MCAFRAERIFFSFVDISKSKTPQKSLMTWALEEHCSEINVILIQKVNFRIYSGTMIKQACFISDTLVYDLLFLGTMKLMD